jgi:hypothetical protein
MTSKSASPLFQIKPTQRPSKILVVYLFGGHLKKVNIAMKRRNVLTCKVGFYFTLHLFLNL